MDKAWQRGLKVWIWTGDNEHLREMDDLLWTFRQDSFVPHETFVSGDANAAPEAPVILSADENAPPAMDVLINLSGRLPALDQLPERVAEFVGPEEEARAQGRERFRGYREMQCELTTHEL